jgi:N-methylhydantoinase A
LATVADALVLDGFDTLQRRTSALLDADGVPRRDQGFRLRADMRHIGQWHDLAVDIPQRLLKGGVNREGLAALFHRQHRELYGHSDPSAPIEFRGLSIEATGKLSRAAPAPVEVAPASNVRSRSIILEDPLHPTTVAVHDRASLGPGQRLNGPLLISQKDSTTVVFPGQFLQVLDDGALLVLEGRA